MGLRNAIPCRAEFRTPSRSAGLTSEGQERDELWTLSRSARPPQSRIINRLSVDSNEGNVDSAETIHGSPMG